MAAKLAGVVVGMIISALVSGQTIQELDKKGGFKEFKIGDDVSVHADKIKFTKTLDNADTKLYLVKERVSVKTYTGEVELVFYKGKMQDVIVSFKNSSKSDFEDLLKSLETLFGQYEKGKENSAALERFEKMFFWHAERIALRIGYDEQYKLTEIVYAGNKDSLDKLREEF